MAPHNAAPARATEAIQSASTTDGHGKDRRGDVTVVPAEDTTCRQAGVAPIRAEFLQDRTDSTAQAQGGNHSQQAAHTEGARAGDAADDADERRAGGDGEAPCKKLKGAARKKAMRAAQAGSGGGKQNKHRKFGRVADARGICHAVARGIACCNVHRCVSVGSPASLTRRCWP